MNQKHAFIEFLFQNKALLFGEFKLKSGRKSPYFFNLGLLNTGEQLSLLGDFYATAIYEKWGDSFDTIFGPAYKGIPLAVVITTQLNQKYGINKKYSSNRKEVKTYADKSALLGANLQDNDKLVLVDDVISTGQTKIEAVKLVTSIANVEIKELVIGLDRLETNTEGKNAISSFTNETKIPVQSIITARDILDYVTKKHDEHIGIATQIETYLQKYGV